MRERETESQFSHNAGCQREHQDSQQPIKLSHESNGFRCLLQSSASDRTLELSCLYKKQ